jgi:type IV pilus assembly protein PilX
MMRSSTPSSHRALPVRADQRGFSLIVALMMLIVIIILGISGSQMAINEERGSRANRDRQIAFQAAEAALKDAEFEIYGAGSPACNVPGQVNGSRMRTGTLTCFNQLNRIGYVQHCSQTPTVGLCLYDELNPAYLDSQVDFLADAKGGSTPRTIFYGQYTHQVFASQATAGSSPNISKYPPRYIIEQVPKNTSIDTSTGGPGGGWMFRVTAMGFGANPNAQVVLQAVVATPY